MLRVASKITFAVAMAAIGNDGLENLGTVVMYTGKVSRLRAFN